VSRASIYVGQFCNSHTIYYFLVPVGSDDHSYSYSVSAKPAGVGKGTVARKRAKQWISREFCPPRKRKGMVGKRRTINC
jgi:hypothetical protein